MIVECTTSLRFAIDIEDLRREIAELKRLLEYRIVIDFDGTSAGQINLGSHVRQVSRSPVCDYKVRTLRNEQEDLDVES